MTEHDEFDRSLARWFEAEARPAATSDVLERTLRATSQRRPRPGLVAAVGSRWVGDATGVSSGAGALGRTGVRTAIALVLLLLAVVAGSVVGARLLQPAPVDLQPAPGDLGIFAPVTGRIVYGDTRGIWGVDPAASADPTTRVQLASEPGTPLGWSSDGTRLLVTRGSYREQRLFVLHADGSETQLTDRPMEIRGATISPDGSRVVFASVRQLYAVDADGGPGAVLVESRYGYLDEPTFSPDGTRIAYADGAGDHSHTVWVIDADGSDAHQVLSNESTAGAGHVSDLAWSPADDLIALGLEGTIYTFAPDGSDFRQVAGADLTCAADDPCAVTLPETAASLYWAPDGSQIAYTTGCVSGAGFSNRDGCHLEIADADGSNAQAFGFPSSGPWHPGPVISDEPPPASGMWPQTSLEEVRRAQELADAGDPRYTWQIDRDLGSPQQLGQNHPHDAQIFTRFLEEELGWEEFRWDEAFAHPDGLRSGDVVYIRCAPGGTNPLYPDDAASGCAPTIDELRYETVKLNVAQLGRQDAAGSGIWVVTGWEMIEPVEQIAPPSNAEVAALMDAFLQARIDGKDAERFVDFAEDDPLVLEGLRPEVPLLYASSTGAPYERSKFELVGSPVWPSGRTRVMARLFADSGATVVEQRFSLERDATGRLGLVYDFDFQSSGPAGPDRATTENGKAVPVE